MLDQSTKSSNSRLSRTKSDAREEFKRFATVHASSGYPTVDVSSVDFESQRQTTNINVRQSYEVKSPLIAKTNKKIKSTAH